MSDPVPDAVAAAHGAEPPSVADGGAPARSGSGPSRIGDVASARGRTRHPVALSLVIAACIVVADQVTKHWALQRLGDGDEVHVVWTLQFNLAYNSGMAFSRGRGLGPLIGVVAVVVVGVLAVGASRLESRVARFAAGLLIGGAVGNLCDRVFREDAWLRGRVIDFIDFQWFPIFNVADMGVTVGAILFLLATLAQARAEERAARALAATATSGAGTSGAAASVDDAGPDIAP